jgi:hypothetical protein
MGSALLSSLDANYAGTMQVSNPNELTAAAKPLTRNAI